MGLFLTRLMAVLLVLTFLPLSGRRLMAAGKGCELNGHVAMESEASKLPHKSLPALADQVVKAVGQAGEDFLDEAQQAQLGLKVADRALSYAGQGQGGFDCSLFVLTVLAEEGVDDGPWSASAFGYWGDPIEGIDALTLGNYDALEEILRPGDVLGYDSFFSGQTSHVGIYVGDGQVVHVNTTFGVIELCDLGLVVGYPITFARRVEA